MLTNNYYKCRIKSSTTDVEKITAQNIEYAEVPTAKRIDGKGDYNMKFNGKLLAVFAIASGLAVSTPVWAEGFQTRDGVMTIETPDKNWAETQEKDAVMALANGKNKIIVEHYSNGEKLPDITTADSDHAMTCQNIISTKDEVFIITGFAAEQDSFQDVQKTVQSAVVNKYGTKKAVVNTVNGTTGNAAKTTADGKYTVDPVSFTGWIKGSQVNIRSECSVKSDIMGQLYTEEAVTVTGYISSGKEGTAWYQVDYNGSKGYIAAEYVSREPSTAETKGIELTDERVTLYSEDGSSAAYVYRSTNGNWYDGSGRQYSPNGSGVWTLTTNGSTWTEDVPETPADSAYEEVVVQDEDGYNTMTLYGDGSGSWSNIAGGSYTDNGDGTWTGPDGTLWYEIG